MSEDEAKEPLVGVDVVIPCYQYGRFLRDCVTSVLTQGIRDVRVLIIDNASTDNSVEVAQQLAAEDRRVTVVARRRNLGLHASYNEGIDWASSKYFMVLCADDLLAPGCLAGAASVMERHPEVGFAYGRAVWFRPQDPIPVPDADPRDLPWRVVAGEEILERFCRDGADHIPGPSAVVVRTVAQKLAGYYRPELPHTTDFEMWMRLARVGPAANTEAYLAILRLHTSSLTASASRDYACDRPPALPWEDEAAFESFFSHEGALLPEGARRHLHQLAKRSLTERAYWAAVAHLCRGQPGASGDLFKFAFGRRPMMTIVPPLGYLFKREDAAHRIVSVASEMVRWPRPAVRPAQAKG
jgi:GT2 family glycosyltransferase